MRGFLPSLASSAARAVWLHVRDTGLPAGRLPLGAEKLSEVEALAEMVARVLDEDETPTFLALRLPDPLDAPWCPEISRSRLVAGVCLTPAWDGTLHVNGTIYGWRTGDLFTFRGGAEYATVPNHTTVPRLTAYWRWES